VDTPRQVRDGLIFERTKGTLRVDFVLNKVTFLPNEGVEYQLPISPLDICIARSLSEYAKTKTQDQSGRSEIAVGKTVR
jgi:hypothetical protein